MRQLPNMKVHKSVRPVRDGYAPELWASLKPFGFGEQHANNFLEVFRAFWENRDKLGYAFRILNQGVCDGCALGTKGMRDWTVTGIHFAKGKSAEAIGDYTEAIRLDPNYAAAYRDRGLAYGMRGKLNEMRADHATADRLKAGP